MKINTAVKQYMTEAGHYNPAPAPQMPSARDQNIFLVKIYTYSRLILKAMDDINATAEDALVFRDILQEKIEEMESADVYQLFQRTNIVSTLEQKFEYNLIKEFDKLNINLNPDR